MAFRLFKNKPPEEVDFTQDNDTVELNKRISDMVRLAEQEDDGWQKIADDGIDYTYGNQLKYINLKEGWEPIQCNFIFPAMMQQAALVQQQKTTIYANPREDSDVAGAEIAEGVMRWYYDVGLKVPKMRGACLIDGFIGGHWVLMPYWEDRPDGGWNEDTKDWDGQVRVAVVPREYFKVAPDTENLGDAEHIHIKRRVYIEWAKARWPEYADKIGKAAALEAALVDRETGGPLPTDYKPHLISQDTSGVGTGERKVSQKPAYYGRLPQLIGKRVGDLPGEPAETEHLNTVTLTEIWFKDREIREAKGEEVPIPDEELDRDKVTYIDPETGLRMLAESGEQLTEENRPLRILPTYEEPVYPYGRHVLRIGEDIILNDKEEEQRWPYKQGWPFISGPFQELPHTWHGANGVELLRELQDNYNIACIHVLNYVKFFADPQVIVEWGAIHGVKSREDLVKFVKANAGTVIVTEKNQLGGYKREGPPALGGALLAILSLFEQLMRNVSGIQEISVGKSSGGQITATESLRLETNTRLRTALLSGHLDRTTGPELMGWIWVLVKDNMSVGEVVRIVGEGGREATVEIFGEGEDEETGEMIAGTLDAEFDLDIQVGTTMPFDKQRQKEEAMALFEMVGPSFLRRLLDAYDVPNPDELIQGNRVSSIIEQIQELEPEIAEQIIAQIEEMVGKLMAMAEGGGEEGGQAAFGEGTEGFEGGAPILEQEQVG